MTEREDLLVGTFPSVPKQERALKKREALLESGRILFISKGYEQTTAKDIAANAGVATGTFYRYFSDKRQLLMSLLEDKLENLYPPEPKWLVNEPITQLASLLKSHAENLEEWGLHRVLPELLPKDPELAEVLRRAKKTIHSHILTGLKQAREKGLTWEDLDLETVAWSIMLLAQNVHEKETHCDEKDHYLEVAKVICRLVFPPEVFQMLHHNKA